MMSFSESLRTELVPLSNPIQPSRRRRLTNCKQLSSLLFDDYYYHHLRTLYYYSYLFRFRSIWIRSPSVNPFGSKTPLIDVPPPPYSKLIWSLILSPHLFEIYGPIRTYVRQ